MILPTKKTPIKEILAELGLPEHAEFLGYVVRLRHSDEFLAHSLPGHDMNLNLNYWSKVPDLAKRYQSYKKALRFVNQYRKGSEVALLFDVGSQYYVASNMEPIW